MPPTRILIVDDEARYLRALRLNLEQSGYAVLTAQNGQQAVDLALSESPDLILLDLRMPVMDGYEACRQIRAFSNVPILMLTALVDLSDKVRGFHCGADDYLTKPFGAQELLARVRALLRRRAAPAQPGEAAPLLSSDVLTVDCEKNTVTVRGELVHLTSTEFRLLCELAAHPHQVFTPEYLLERVWGQGYQGDYRILWQAIHRLRQKIEVDAKHPQLIQTKSGVGYVFVP